MPRTILLELTPEELVILRCVLGKTTITGRKELLKKEAERYEAGQTRDIIASVAEKLSAVNYPDTIGSPLFERLVDLMDTIEVIRDTPRLSFRDQED